MTDDADCSDATESPPEHTPPVHRAGGRGGGGAVPTGPPEPGTSRIAGISIVKPKELGGITAYDMNSGDKKWWTSNGGAAVPTVQAASPDAALFSGVTLPPQPASGHAQVITTKSLVIYCTGRQGGAPASAPPRLLAVDKATGKEVGSVVIPSKTTAVPMTFMFNGRQYIVFATGQTTNTVLVALTLPK